MSSNRPTVTPWQRAFNTTAQLEEGWHVEWAGWKMMAQWPLKVGQWWCFSLDKKTYLLAETWVADTENDPVVFRHAKDECRLRLRMFIYQHNVIEEARATDEAASDDPSQPGPGS